MKMKRVCTSFGFNGLVVYVRLWFPAWRTNFCKNLFFFSGWASFALGPGLLLFSKLCWPQESNKGLSEQARYREAEVDLVPLETVLV